MQQDSSGSVLFADVSGSTKLYEAVGDKVAHAAIDQCVKLFSALTEQHGGRVIKTIGDEVMSVFPDPGRATKAAVDIQLGIREMPPVEKTRLGVRVGFHHGPLVHRDGDVFGDAVNLAARLSDLASKGQIITSLETVQQLEPIQRLDCRSLYEIQVKGKEKGVMICEVLWAGTDDATTMLASSPAAPAAESRLRVTYKTHTVELSEERPTLVLGRDATVDLVVPDRMASRTHCVIEKRQDKYWIVDRSANGTYICEDGDREIVLRREGAMLRKHGFITLGQSRATATEVVEFFCE